MSSENEFYYELTGSWGKDLKDSIGERKLSSKFDDMVSDEHTYAVENMAPGKELRDRLVDKIMDELSEDDIIEIADIAKIEKDDQTLSLLNETQSSLEERVRVWLLENECPAEIFDEEGFVQNASWVWEYAGEDVQLSWDGLDQEDDFEVALFFGYLKYPPYNRETKCYEEGDSDCIPLDVVNKLTELDNLQSKAAMESEQRYKNAECLKLGNEIRGVRASLILVNGVKTGYDEFDLPCSMPVDEIPTCPCCGVMFDYKGPGDIPKTANEIFEYLLAADGDEPVVTCPDCGNGGEEFAEVWLKFVGCTLPDEYLDKRLWKGLKLLAA